MRYVALLRGINVGGNKKLAMSKLRNLLTELGYADVATYIQSGNAIFSSPSADAVALEREIENRIQLDTGMDVSVLVRTGPELNTVVAANPFAASNPDPKTLHAIFLSSPLGAVALSDLRPDELAPDAFHAGDRVVYLYVPSGFRDSKMVKELAKRLRRGTTTRNWNTVNKLRDLANGPQA